jgi:hypothetical protein
MEYSSERRFGFGGVASGVGSSYRSVVGTVGLGVGFEGGVDPLCFTHDLTSDTLETNECILLGVFSGSVLQCMPPSSM